MNTTKIIFYTKLCALMALGVVNVAVWHAYVVPKSPRFEVDVLSVGQGDSILFQGPTGITMLIDGGPDHSVLRELGRELPFFKRSIDLVVETHPDSDHITGLTSVFERFAVSYFMSPGIPNETSQARALVSAVQDEPNVHSFIARRGMRIHLGGGAYADVLYPDKDVSKGETNDGSIVMRVVYGTTSFMMTGDAPSTVEDHLVNLGGGNATLESTVLKAGHHGSKHSTDDVWLAAVRPKYVAISAGKGNSYGHPHQEVLDRIKKEGAAIVSTIDRGTLHFISDGATVWVK